MADLNDSQARTPSRIPLRTQMPQRAHLVDVGDLILLQTPEVRARFGGVDRLTIDRVHGRWAWAGAYGFTPQTLREWLDAGIVALACVPPLLPTQATREKGIGEDA